VKTRSFVLGLTGLLAVVGGFGWSQEVLQSTYFPLGVGNEWHYRSGKEQVIMRVDGHEVIEVLDEKDKPMKIQAAVVELRSGNRKVIERYAVAADGVYRVSSAGHQINPPLRFLKLPSKDGDSWIVNSESEGVPLKGMFTMGSEDIVVPAGKFQTSVASTKNFQIGAETTTITYWFAENVGMVKQQVKVGNFDRVLELVTYNIKK